MNLISAETVLAFVQDVAAMMHYAERKADERTYFIDRLREVMLKRMEEDDEKHYHRK